MTLNQSLGGKGTRFR